MKEVSPGVELRLTFGQAEGKGKMFQKRQSLGMKTVCKYMLRIYVQVEQIVCTKRE